MNENTRRERVETLPPELDGPDLEALDEALAYIQAHPEQWNQDTWRCSTSMCLAGWVGELGGATWLTDHDGRTPDGGEVLTADGLGLGLTAHDLVKAVGETAVISWLDAEVRDAVGVAEWARRRLGLREDQAAELFEGSNTLADLKAMRDRLAADPSADLYLGLDAEDPRDVAEWSEL